MKQWFWGKWGTKEKVELRGRLMNEANDDGNFPNNDSTTLRHRP